MLKYTTDLSEYKSHSLIELKLEFKKLKIINIDPLIEIIWNYTLNDLYFQKAIDFLNRINSLKKGYGIPNLSETYKSLFERKSLSLNLEWYKFGDRMLSKVKHNNLKSAIQFNFINITWGDSLENFNSILFKKFPNIEAGYFRFSIITSESINPTTIFKNIKVWTRKMQLLIIDIDDYLINKLFGSENLSIFVEKILTNMCYGSTLMFLTTVDGLPKGKPEKHKIEIYTGNKYCKFIHVKC
jgi:hypothetical protein